MNTNRIRTTVTPCEDRPTATGAGITGIAYAFPAEARSVSELAAAGALRSEPAVLRSFGFEQVHTAATEAPFDLALSAARPSWSGTGSIRDRSTSSSTAGPPPATPRVPGARGCTPGRR
jgi:hypothetical protein